VLRVAEARSPAPRRCICSPSAALEPRRRRGSSPLTSRARARHPDVICVANGAPQHLNPARHRSSPWHRRGRLAAGRASPPGRLHASRATRWPSNDLGRFDPRPCGQSARLRSHAAAVVGSRSNGQICPHRSSPAWRTVLAVFWSFQLRFQRSFCPRDRLDE
jgi:hypothetical protein